MTSFVTGSLDAAIRGDMIMFVGGTDKAVENVKEVLEAIGEIRRVGDYGNGYVAKLVNNQLWKINAAGHWRGNGSCKKSRIRARFVVGSYERGSGR